MEISGEQQKSEAELIDRARHGSDAAWETLVRKHQQTVFRLAYLLIGDADEAEDIAQESFIRAFRAIDSFDESRPLRPWLLRITTNLAHNRRRSLGRYIAALRRSARLDVEPAAALGDRSVAHWEATALWQAIRRLKHQDQEVLYLRYFLELSETEMANALEVAPGTVKSRLHRALSRLRKIINVEFPDLREERDLSR